MSPELKDKLPSIIFIGDDGDFDVLSYHLRPLLEDEEYESLKKAAVQSMHGYASEACIRLYGSKRLHAAYGSRTGYVRDRDVFAPSCKFFLCSTDEFLSDLFGEFKRVELQTHTSQEIDMFLFQ